MESDEDSITLSMDEYARMQNDILSVKHENARLKESNEKHDEVLKQLHACQEEIHRLKSPEEDPLKKLPKFSRDIVLNCLKSVRKQEDFDKEQFLLIEQILAIVEYIWPKGGDQELKLSDMQECASHNELKVIRETNQRLKNNLEEMEEKSKAMKYSIEETARENLKMGQKISDLVNQKEHLIIDLASREEELIEARKQLKDKYALECKKNDLEIEIANLHHVIEKMKNDLEFSKETQGSSEKVKQLLIEIEEMKNNENMLNLEYSNLKVSAKQHLSELSNNKNQLKEAENTIKRLEEFLKKLQLEIEDMKTERQILQKRTMHDLKDLKAELAKEKTVHEQCKMDKEKVMQENRKLQENLRAGVKLAPPTHQEKVLVESMSNKIGELEKENHAIRGKLKELINLGEENSRILSENEELKNEINRLSMDIGIMGAQFNEYIRNANQSKVPISK